MFTRIRKQTSILAAVLLPLLVTGCGSESGEAASAKAAGDPVTVVVPFNSCLAWYPLYVAQYKDYFAENGIDVKIRSQSGSTAAIQTVLAGQAEVALPTLLDTLFAIQKGAELTSFYAFYTGSIYSMVTPADGPINDLEDLKGETVGVTAFGEGETNYGKALLDSVGLQKDADYKMLPVGRGGQAAVALQEGVVAAYAASYYGRVVIEQRGIDLRVLKNPEFPTPAGELLVAKTSWTKSHPQQIKALGKSIAQASEWSRGRLDEVAKICGKVNPEEKGDPEFSHALLTVVEKLTEPVNGKPGYMDVERIRQSMNKAVEMGQLPAPVDLSHFTNKYVDSFN